MENLWAPWRMHLFRQPAIPGCFFCEYIKQNQDEQNLILERAEHCFVIMNRFPYNSGHLLIAPYLHIGDITQINAEIRAALMELVARWQSIVHQTMHPQGFNIGMNQGVVAGAGNADHLHWHLVPRWNGDTSFISLLSDTKIINQALTETYRDLKATSIAKV